METPRAACPDPAFTITHHTCAQPGVMVWVAIFFYSRTPLVVIRGLLTAHRYVDDILRTVLLPFLFQYPGLIFQQDNARYGTFCYELCYNLSSTSLASQIARSLSNRAYREYDGKLCTEWDSGVAYAQQKEENGGPLQTSYSEARKLRYQKNFNNFRNGLDMIVTDMTCFSEVICLDFDNRYSTLQLQY
ncbi:uncharacterized protein TNCV_1106821 [Trichonephila clavipes]|nr:uncharacterized protein TNCV_1106821 [Trichonephila clavipes]